MSTAQELVGHEPLKILIVDDDVDALRLLSKQIHLYLGESALVYQSTDSQKALSIIEEKGVALLVTDLDMIDVNGFHLLKAVKVHDPMTQVVILTAHDSANAIRSAFSMGADEYFCKPVRIDELMDCIIYLSRRMRRWQRSVAGLYSPVQPVTAAPCD